MSQQHKHARMKAFCDQHGIVTHYRPGQEMQWSAERKELLVERHSEVMAIRAICQILFISCPF